MLGLGNSCADLLKVGAACWGLQDFLAFSLDKLMVRSIALAIYSCPRQLLHLILSRSSHFSLELSWLFCSDLRRHSAHALRRLFLR